LKQADRVLSMKSTGYLESTISV